LLYCIEFISYFQQIWYIIWTVPRDLHQRTLTNWLNPFHIWFRNLWDILYVSKVGKIWQFQGSYGLRWLTDFAEGSLVLRKFSYCDKLFPISMHCEKGACKNLFFRNYRYLYIITL
jgi:hypothetical protein